MLLLLKNFSLENVTLYPVMHRGIEQILIQCGNVKELE